MKKSLLLLFIGLSFIYSCSNDSINEIIVEPNPIDIQPPNLNGTTGFLKKMSTRLANNNDLISVSYFSYIANKLNKRIEQDVNNPTIFGSENYEYTNDLITKIYSGNYVTEYIYDNQNRIKTAIFFNSKSEFDYSNNIIRWKYFSKDTDNNYNLIGDNIIQVDNYNQITNINNYGTNTPALILEYDNKIAPMRNILGFNKLLNNYNPNDGIYNNIIKQIDPNMPSNNITVDYEYNSSNKPSKITYSNINDGAYLIIELEYY
ncbi:hypothetical protein FLGE108171_15440 [Flavobacterium gelidilacus]|uniref:hypothetical protein n=1 Tax=Flavobacterium gelidilacus TaxID=206041 RepID=UPI00047BBDB6|nr:hypothetical protein [Flavobacterium gelidilacus]